MEPKVIFEDKYLLVIDKPAGMVVNRAESVKGETVQDWVERKLKIKNEKLKIDEGADFVKRSGIVHRIDKETSGLLLIAKTPEVFAELQRQFKARVVEKVYLALVHGKVFPPEGEIKAPVGRLPWARVRFGVIPGGREALTEYKAIKNLKFTINNQELSLVEFYPKTGRTHQIRVHAKSIGHPLVGDNLYAGRKTARRDRTWLPRLFLHASRITFTHPKTHKKMTVEVPLPADLSQALTTLAI